MARSKVIKNILLHSFHETHLNNFEKSKIKRCCPNFIPEFKAYISVFLFNKSANWPTASNIIAIASFKALIFIFIKLTKISNFCEVKETP